MPGLSVRAAIQFVVAGVLEEATRLRTVLRHMCDTMSRLTDVSQLPYC
jgi:hypothetical protein